MINITPYKELRFGDESIYDKIRSNEDEIPKKVIDYLRAGNAHLMSPGIYDHPFKKEIRLLGPYILTDNNRYIWDRDTWKYVVKYRLALPEEFIEFVLGNEGSKVYESMVVGKNWNNVIQDWKATGDSIIFLPDNADDKELCDF